MKSSLIKQEDIEKLSQEDLELFLDYFKELKTLNKEVQILENEGNNEESQKKRAKLFLFNNIKSNEKRRNGLHVLNEIINNLSLFEYCSRIWVDYLEVLVEKNDNRFKEFENNYQLLKKSGKKHDEIISELVLEFEKTNSKLSFALEIGSVKLKEVLKNLEKYNLLLSDKEAQLDINKPEFYLELDRLEIKYPNDINSHLRFLENEEIKEFDNLKTTFLEKNAIKIMMARLNFELLNKFKSYEEPISNLRAEEITLNRQVMAVYSLLRALEVTQIDITKIAEFIQFITKRDLNYSKIKDTEIYNKLRIRETSKKDKEFLKREFEKIGLEFKI